MRFTFSLGAALFVGVVQAVPVTSDASYASTATRDIAESQATFQELLALAVISSRLFFSQSTN